MEFEGKIAIVTGAASGLGKATAAALRERGATVLGVDLDEVEGESFVADVSSLEQNQAMVAHAVERFGGIDFVHLNAGVASLCSLGEDFTQERYRTVMGVNLDGVVFGTHAVLPALVARGGGAIVATSSLAGLAAVPFDPLYSANKHAVVGLARSLGPALVSQNVRFNAVCPGFAESKIIEPIRGYLEATSVPIIPAQAVADAVVRLFGGDESGECWFVQAGREAQAFEFRRVPGPRVAEEGQ